MTSEHFQPLTNTADYRAIALMPYLKASFYSDSGKPIRFVDVVVFAAVDKNNTCFDRIVYELNKRSFPISWEDVLFSLESLSKAKESPVSRTGKWHIPPRAHRMHDNVRQVLKWKSEDLSWIPSRKEAGRYCSVWN